MQVDSKDDFSRSLLWYATKNGHLEVVSLLDVRITARLSSPNDMVASSATMSSLYPRRNCMQISFGALRTCIEQLCTVGTEQYPFCVISGKEHNVRQLNTFFGTYSEHDTDHT